MGKIHCMFHSQDLDGHCSGAIVKYRFPEAVMHPINYGDEFPWHEIQRDDEVYMVDFCLQPRSLMRRLVDSFGTLHYIDHHADAVKEMRHMCGPNGLAYMGRDCLGEKAACELTWEYLFPDRPVPLAVKLLSLYDSWTYQGHELEGMVLPFQMRMRMENLNPRDWEKCEGKWLSLFEDEWTASDKSRSIHVLIEEGRLLLSYDEEQKRRYVKTYGFDTTLDWVRKGDTELLLDRYKAITVNLGHTNSKVFDSVANGWWCETCEKWIDPVDVTFQERHDERSGGCGESVDWLPKYDLMITFCRRSDRLWNVSLYSTKASIDCGAVAKTFGGGGHKGAAGFQCESLPFEY